MTTQRNYKSRGSSLIYFRLEPLTKSQFIVDGVEDDQGRSIKVIREQLTFNDTS